jgi:hypothetical protein
MPPLPLAVTEAVNVFLYLAAKFVWYIVSVEALLNQNVRQKITNLFNLVLTEICEYAACMMGGNSVKSLN